MPFYIYYHLLIIIQNVPDLLHTDTIIIYITFQTIFVISIFNLMQFYSHKCHFTFTIIHLLSYKMFLIYTQISIKFKISEIMFSFI
ncbi:hypothetical protein ECH_0323 [Ehrlichia chaffeensis str. Arkansas]|uniref:Uncharacterized protein n=1 Tax=Ehrlichia chaffeensis (strain ATCC CRL-10679 / Arkansas) TaxID=205920 RepID=Q2GHD9_EHRCR|nr:hypothetical protein ECH_0323 [Ehrlichia chaffeensis str. Arkansas]